MCFLVWTCAHLIQIFNGIFGVNLSYIWKLIIKASFFKLWLWYHGFFVNNFQDLDNINFVTMVFLGYYHDGWSQVLFKPIDICPTMVCMWSTYYLILIQLLFDFIVDYKVALIFWVGQMDVFALCIGYLFFALPFPTNQLHATKHFNLKFIFCDGHKQHVNVFCYLCWIPIGTKLTINYFHFIFLFLNIGSFYKYRLHKKRN